MTTSKRPTRICIFYQIELDRCVHPQSACYLKECKPDHHCIYFLLFTTAKRQLKQREADKIAYERDKAIQ